MEKIGLNGKVYTILQARSYRLSETMKGRFQRLINPEFQDTGHTLIEFAKDYGVVGITHLESSLVDTIAYITEIENDGMIAAFTDMSILYRDATASEADQILEIIQANRQKATQRKRPDLYKLFSITPG